MKELNRHTLLKALEKLKVHIPSEEVWNNIDKTLDSEYILEEHLQNMPMHQAPDFVWDNIESGLETEMPAKKSKMVFLRPLIAAASMALLAGFIFFNNGPLVAHDEVQVSYSIEDYPIVKFQRDDYNNFAADEALKQMVSLQHEQSSTPEDKELLAELEELKIASDKLKSVLGKFDTDRGLIEKLNTIELERKELMDKIFTNQNNQG